MTVRVLVWATLIVLLTSLEAEGMIRARSEVFSTPETEFDVVVSGCTPQLTVPLLSISRNAVVAAVDPAPSGGTGYVARVTVIAAKKEAVVWLNMTEGSLTCGGNPSPAMAAKAVYLPPSDEEKGSSFSLSFGGIPAVAVVIVIALVLLCGCCVAAFYMKRHKKHHTDASALIGPSHAEQYPQQPPPDALPSSPPGIGLSPMGESPRKGSPRKGMVAYDPLTSPHAAYDPLTSPHAAYEALTSPHSRGVEEVPGMFTSKPHPLESERGAVAKKETKKETKKDAQRRRRRSSSRGGDGGGGGGGVPFVSPRQAKAIRNGGNGGKTNRGSPRGGGGGGGKLNASMPAFALDAFGASSKGIALNNTDSRVQPKLTRRQSSRALGGNSNRPRRETVGMMPVKKAGSFHMGSTTRNRSNDSGESPTKTSPTRIRSSSRRNILRLSESEVKTEMSSSPHSSGKSSTSRNLRRATTRTFDAIVSSDRSPTK